MKKIEFSNQDIQDIILMYENNCSLKLIGEKFNCDQGVIKRKLVELNIGLEANYINNSNFAHKF